MFSWLIVACLNWQQWGMTFSFWFMLKHRIMSNYHSCQNQPENCIWTDKYQPQNAKKVNIWHLIIENIQSNSLCSAGLSNKKLLYMISSCLGQYFDLWGMFIFNTHIRDLLYNEFWQYRIFYLTLPWYNDEWLSW